MRDSRHFLHLSKLLVNIGAVMVVMMMVNYHHHLRLRRVRHFETEKKNQTEPDSFHSLV
jgi:hypothetical protein